MEPAATSSTSTSSSNSSTSSSTCTARTWLQHGPHGPVQSQCASSWPKALKCNLSRYSTRRRNGSLYVHGLPLDSVHIAATQVLYVKPNVFGRRAYAYIAQCQRCSQSSASRGCSETSTTSGGAVRALGSLSCGLECESCQFRLPAVALRSDATTASSDGRAEGDSQHIAVTVLGARPSWLICDSQAFTTLVNPRSLLLIHDTARTRASHGHANEHTQALTSSLNITPSEYTSDAGVQSTPSSTSGAA